MSVKIYKLLKSSLLWAIDSVFGLACLLGFSFPLVIFVLVRISQFGDLKAARYDLLLKNIFFSLLSYLISAAIIRMIRKKNIYLLTGAVLAVLGTFIHTMIEIYQHGNYYLAREQFYYEGIFAIVFTVIIVHSGKILLLIENWFSPKNFIERMIE